jgi:hypothetical protein
MKVNKLSPQGYSRAENMAQHENLNHYESERARETREREKSNPKKVIEI